MKTRIYSQLCTDRKKVICLYTRDGSECGYMIETNNCLAYVIKMEWFLTIGATQQIFGNGCFSCMSNANSSMIHIHGQRCILMNRFNNRCVCKVVSS